MPASFESISSKKVTLTLPLDEDNPDSDTITLVYKPKALTKAYEREFNEIMAHQNEQMVGAEITIRTFLLMVTSWDAKLKDSDSDPIPLTPEGLENVPTQSLQYLLRKIGEDQQPDPKAKTS